MPEVEGGWKNCLDGGSEKAQDLGQLLDSWKGVVQQKLALPFHLPELCLKGVKGSELLNLP